MFWTGPQFLENAGARGKNPETGNLTGGRRVDYIETEGLFCKNARPKGYEAISAVRSSASDPD
jgi:hypothetical protein